MKHFESPEDEVVFLFGQREFDKARKRGPAYFVRRVPQQQMRDAWDGLRFRVGPERKRFARSLPPDVAGALMFALLDSNEWNRLVMEAAIAKVPQPTRRRRARARKRTVRPVRKRRIRTAVVKDDDDD